MNVSAIARTVARWLVSNLVWLLVSGATGSFLLGVGRTVVGIDDPYLLASFGLVGAAAVFVFLRPLVRSWWFHRNKELKVTIDHVEWDTYRGQARIVEMRVTVENRTEKRKKLWSSHFQFSGGGSPGTANDADLWREVERRRKTRRRPDEVAVLEPRGDPNSKATAWIVHELPWSSQPGEPAWTLTVHDELNEPYEAEVRKSWRERWF